ncbi:hypothetical protein ACJJTC_014996 [Scirpophaga incertulas]
MSFESRITNLEHQTKELNKMENLLRTNQARSRNFKNVTTSHAADIGYGGDPAGKIFVNDHLTAENKRLLTSVKGLAKEKSFSYVWVKHSKIHVRKNDTSPVFIISTPSDLNRIV